MVLLIGGCRGSDPVETEGTNGGGGPRDRPSSVGSGPAYDPSTATATVSGSIHFDGTPPRMPLLEMSSDFYCQRNGASLATSQEVLVTEDGKLQNVVVYVRLEHEGWSYDVPSEPAVLDQAGCVYIPHVFTMMTTQELAVRNSDRALHNVHSASEINSIFNFAQAAQESETRRTFSRPEMSISIGCDLHSWMRAYISVFDHPFPHDDR